MPARLKAIWLLALALLRTFIKLLFGRGRRGIGAFRANYDEDRLPPVSREERDRLGSFGRCIACGLCDRGEGPRIAASSGRYRGIMSIMVAASRSMPDFQAAALELAFVSDEVLGEKEQICPTEVPMREVARFIRTKAEELGRSLPPAPVEKKPLPAGSKPSSSEQSL